MQNTGLRGVAAWGQTDADYQETVQHMGLPTCEEARDTKI